MAAICSSETWVDFRRTIRRYIEDRTFKNETDLNYIFVVVYPQRQTWYSNSSTPFSQLRVFTEQSGAEATP
jgi:hypothetical protein